jgi:hypothetical protein
MPLTVKFPNFEYFGGRGLVDEEKRVIRVTAWFEAREVSEKYSP